MTLDLRRRLTRTWRCAARLALAIGLTLTPPHVLGFDGNPPPPSATPKVDAADGDRAENAALEFVRENHPELEALLARLKPMKPEQYQRAIRELSLVSKTLAVLKANNPRRHAAALDAWKARSRVQLLTARLANANANGAPAAAELESQLRQAVEARVDAEINQVRVDKQAAEERVRKLTENLARLESRRGSAAENQVQAILKKSQRKSRPAATKATNSDEPVDRKREPQP